MKHRYYKLKKDSHKEGNVKYMSPDRTASPNNKWKAPQLEIHGYIEVELPQLIEHEEVINYNKFTLKDEKVIYHINRLPEAQILAAYKKKRKRQIYSEAMKLIYSKYSREVQLHASLGLYSASFISKLKSDMQIIFDELKSYNNGIDKAKFKEEIFALKANFPEFK